MSSFLAEPCESCSEKQEALLEAGDGSQVLCYCHKGDVDSPETPKGKPAECEPPRLKRKSVSKDTPLMSNGEDQPTMKKKLFQSDFPTDEEFNRMSFITKW